MMAWDWPTHSDLQKTAEQAKLRLEADLGLALPPLSLYVLGPVDTCFRYALIIDQYQWIHKISPTLLELHKNPRRVICDSVYATTRQVFLDFWKARWHGPYPSCEECGCEAEFRYYDGFLCFGCGVQKKYPLGVLYGFWDGTSRIYGAQARRRLGITKSQDEFIQQRFAI